jgi:uncharacterized membrane protein
MTHFGWLDMIAIAFLMLSWFAYHSAVELSRFREKSLNAIMALKRRDWMRQTLLRNNRVVDAQLMNGLQNGTAFFASTSLVAIGAVSTLLRVSDDAFKVYRDLPFGFETTRLAWELKVLGLALIFAYAFFKFAWSYRLFNYAAVLMGAIPPADQSHTPEALKATWQAAEMHVVAGRHFNRGQRAFFFAPAYICWFFGPLPFMVATAGVLIVIWNRQFHSDAFRTMGHAPTAEDAAELLGVQTAMTSKAPIIMKDSPQPLTASTRASARMRNESGK